VRQSPAHTGFTLIELSIVLVIIGLIVGGVLVGQDLIKAAEVRATISQIEKYNTAVNTFKEKYGGLPGNLSSAAASSFGFVQRAGTLGRGSNNGILSGINYSNSNSDYATALQTGETALFWVDLSTSHLITGSFTAATDSGISIIDASSQPGLDAWLPTAAIGKGSYIYVYSFNGINYFGLSVPSSIDANGILYSTPMLAVRDAFAIDKKIDDGLPTTGTVQAYYATSWGIPGEGITPAPSSTTPSAATCYDTTSNNYSIAFSNGSNPNCGLRFQFQ
jgi:prepilin-type N-terminal cleavage/methylation domain-containing protein